MKPRPIVPNVYLAGAIDWDRRLFDSLIPLPLGTSYNAYLVQGQDKVALIDTVEPGLAEELFANLDELGVKKIDYVVCHHAEQDHSGSIPAVLARYPGAKVVTNQKCADLLSSHLRVPTTACEIIPDGAVLDLGERSLQFIFAPWVHWPETMFSYLREDKILFTCDFFGSHFATGTLYADDEHHVYLSAKRYYAEIMMPFGGQVTKNIDKVTKYPIRYIAPSHGPGVRRSGVHHRGLPRLGRRRSAEHRVPALREHARQHAAHGGPPHGRAYRSRRGCRERFDLTTLDAGELASSLVHAGTIVLGLSHALAIPAGGLRGVPGQRPEAAHQVRHRDRLLRWAGKTVEMLVGMMDKLKVEFW